MNEFKWPLENVRVADLTWWVAGSETTRILASMGADVIKIEWKASPDPVRYGTAVVRLAGEPPVGIRPMGFRDPKFGPNRGGAFNNQNAGKKGVTLNVKNPNGRKLLEELIAKSDVIIENFSAGVMEGWGLGYEQLQKIKPDIIYISMSGLGHVGRNRDHITMGPIVQALSGLTANSGLPDRAPAGWGFSYMDHFAGYFGTVAVLLALIHRKQTGRGQYVDLSQVECGILLNSLAIGDYTANGKELRRAGNRSQYGGAVPSGIYRCAGTDEWCAIAVSSDEEWARFVSAIGNPDWAREFDTQEKRLLKQDRLDSLVEEWTSQHNANEIQSILQSSGVKAGVSQNAAQRLGDPQLNHRGFFVPLKNTEIGEWPILQIPIKSRRRKMTVGGVIQRASPLLGEHNSEVYGNLLGRSAEEIENYSREGAI